MAVSHNDDLGFLQITYKGLSVIRDDKPVKALELVVVDTREEAVELRKQGVAAVTESWLDFTKLLQDPFNITPITHWQSSSRDNVVLENQLLLKL